MTIFGYTLWVTPDTAKRLQIDANRIQCRSLAHNNTIRWVLNYADSDYPYPNAWIDLDVTMFLEAVGRCSGHWISSSGHWSSSSGHWSSTTGDSKAPV